MASKHILVVEDERVVRNMICTYLRQHGFAVSEAGDVASAQRQLCKQTPDLIVLERVLPARGGLDLALSVRSSQRHWMPLLMIAGHASEGDRVAALDAGVDFVLTKPFSPRELLARVNALLRRGEKIKPPSRDRNAGLVLDAARQSVIVGDRALELGPMDFRLLTFFIQNPERAHSRSALLKRVWGDEVRAEQRTVDAQIQRLRNALSPLQLQHLIQTVRGVGYRFSAYSESMPSSQLPVGTA